MFYSITCGPGAVNVPFRPEVEIIDHVPAGGRYDDGHQGGVIHVGVHVVVHNVDAYHGVVASLL